MSEILIVPGHALGHSDVNEGLVSVLRSRGLEHVIPALDPRYRNLSTSDLSEVLRARWEPQLIEDGLSTGKLRLMDGRLRAIFKTELPIIAGYIFEALTVRIANDRSKEIGRNLFKWVTERQRLRAGIFEPFTAIGLGFPATHPSIKNATLEQFDIIFTRLNETLELPEPAPIYGTNITAGLQIKAIRGQETSEIIEPILSGQYRRVLTFLKHLDGSHSADAVEKEVRRRRLLGKLDEESAEKIRNAVARPSQFGIDERDVEDYFEYIRRWHAGEASDDDNILRAAGALAQMDKYGQTSVLSL